MATFVFNTAKAAILRGEVPALYASYKVMLLAGQKTGCTITGGNTDITAIGSTSNLLAGMYVEHADFPVGTTIASVLGATSVRCTNIAGAGSTGQVVTFKPDKKQDYVVDFVGLELSCTNYAAGFGGSGRKAVSNRSVAVDDTNSQAWLDANDLTWSALGTAEVVTGSVLICEMTSDSDSYAIAHFDDGYPLTLAGTDLTQAWNASGLLRG